jgi:hypothetical protein
VSKLPAHSHGWNGFNEGRGDSMKMLNNTWVSSRISSAPSESFAGSRVRHFSRISAIQCIPGVSSLGAGLVRYEQWYSALGKSMSRLWTCHPCQIILGLDSVSSRQSMMNAQY